LRSELSRGGGVCRRRWLCRAPPRRHGRCSRGGATTPGSWGSVRPRRRPPHRRRRREAAARRVAMAAVHGSTGASAVHGATEGAAVPSAWWPSSAACVSAFSLHALSTTAQRLHCGGGSPEACSGCWLSAETLKHSSGCGWASQHARHRDSTVFNPPRSTHAGRWRAQHAHMRGMSATWVSPPRKRQ
jgi:hypothetical protein